MELAITGTIGAIIGMSSGLFGIGGALLATPLLSIGLGLAPKIAVATPLPAAIPSAVSGSVAYSRKRLVRFDVVRRVLLCALPATVVGAWVNRFTPDALLLITTGLLLAYSAIMFLRSGFGRERAIAEVVRTGIARGPLNLASALAGFMSGFLAIGGGMVMVPALVRIAHLDIKEALATSLFCVAALAVPGVVVHAINNHIDWGVALSLAAVVIPFSYLGAFTATRMRSRTLARLYGGAMLLFSIYFIVRNI